MHWGFIAAAAFSQSTDFCVSNLDWTVFGVSAVKCSQFVMQHFAVHKGGAAKSVIVNNQKDTVRPCLCQVIIESRK